MASYQTCSAGWTRCLTTPSSGATSLQVPHSPQDALAQVTRERKSLTHACLFPSQQYNLVNAIEAANAYTVFAPNNDAIENYIREKKVTTLVGIRNEKQGNQFLEIQTFDV